MRASITPGLEAQLSVARQLNSNGGPAHASAISDEQLRSCGTWAELLRSCCSISVQPPPAHHDYNAMGAGGQGTSIPRFPLPTPGLTVHVMLSSFGLSSAHGDEVRMNVRVLRSPFDIAPAQVALGNGF